MVKKVGTREEVWEGLAEETKGKLRKSDLLVNSRGKIVSKARSERAREMQPLGPSLELAFTKQAGGAHSRVAEGGFIVQGSGPNTGGFIVQGSGTTGGAHSRVAEGGFIVQGSGTTGGAHSRVAEGGFIVQGGASRSSQGGATSTDFTNVVLPVDMRGGAKMKMRKTSSRGKAPKNSDMFDHEGTHINYYAIPDNAKFGLESGDYWFIFPDNDDYQYVRLIKFEGEICAVVGNNRDGWKLLTILNPPMVGGSIIDDIISLL
jgi:hypothetical protein